jgi:beta-xylosidase
MKKRNPIIWADIPDVDVIRVDDTYYMVSTTMHTMPGGVIFRSYDLVNWEIASYVYDELEDTPGQRLDDQNGIYGAGMWAASIRYHEGEFYVVFVANDTRKTYLYRAENIEGPWRKSYIEGFYHDCSLYFEDGRAFLIFGGGDIRMVELKPDLSGPLPGGVDKVIVRDRENVGLRYEGSHFYKINGRYYLFNIHWLRTGSGRRVESCLFSDSLEGPYQTAAFEGVEGRTADGDFHGGNILDDDMGWHNQGVAQGGIVDTPDGDWYAMLFQDHGAVGRIPVLVPMKWVDGFPVLGEDGKVPLKLDVPSTRPDYAYSPIVESDGFDYAPGEKLKKQWQWNHIPDNTLWSVTERPGWLRLRTGNVSPNFPCAKNSLTQRTVGPMCRVSVKVDASGLRDGDYAGLGALQSGYGLIAVTRENGKLYIVSLRRDMTVLDEHGRLPRRDRAPGAEIGRVELTGSLAEFAIYFNFDDGVDEACFYYRDERGFFRRLGDVLHMRYTLDHFMGYRAALTCFSTKEPGGCADFDDFDIKVFE